MDCIVIFKPPISYCYENIQYNFILVVQLSPGCLHIVKYPMNRNVTRMWNMISSPATPTVCLEQKSENFQSRNVTLSMPSKSKE